MAIQNRIKMMTLIVVSFLMISKNIIYPSLLSSSSSLGNHEYSPCLHEFFTVSTESSFFTYNPHCAMSFLIGELVVPFIALCHHPAFPSHLQMLLVLVDVNINRLAQVCASTRNMFHFHTQSLYPIHYRCHYMAPVGI